MPQNFENTLERLKAHAVPVAFEFLLLFRLSKCKSNQSFRSSLEMLFISGLELKLFFLAKYFDKSGYTLELKELLTLH